MRSDNTTDGTRRPVLKTTGALAGFGSLGIGASTATDTHDDGTPTDRGWVEITGTSETVFVGGQRT